MAAMIEQRTVEMGRIIYGNDIDQAIFSPLTKKDGETSK